MLVTRKSRRSVRLQNYVFIVLFLAVIGLLGWLSTRYHYSADWTATGRNTLSDASSSLVKQINGPITVTAFARETGAVRKHISEIIARYKRFKPDLELIFVNPDTDPVKVRDHGITVEGELVVEYQHRKENVRELNEQSFTNVLQRLARSGERWIVFLEGHGERNPQGQANHDLKIFADQLKTKGFNIQALNLASSAEIPANTSVLVIADPRVALLPGEIKVIQDYVDNGGTLLWLKEPGPLAGLDALTEKLSIKFLPGVIVDPTTSLVAIDNPAIALAAKYGAHAITQNFNVLSLYPIAGGIELLPTEAWQRDAFVMTAPSAWSETGDLSGEVTFDSADSKGPLNIAISVTRERPASDPKDTNQKQDTKGEQRVVVVGDADFLSNAYVGNVGNLDLGMNIINWLAHDDKFVAIPVKTATDRSLTLDKSQISIIGFGLLLGVPLLLLATGFTIWFRRRRR